MQIAVGALLAAVVAIAAYRLRRLTMDGAFAALLVGTAVFGALGWRGAAVLFAFFIPSALLSRGAQARRNAWQVLANGGVAAICAYLSARGLPPLAAAFAGAFAAASADTWGTEIGTRWGGTPVSILTFRRVALGRSGGITPIGTLATISGAACVAIVAAVVGLAWFESVALGGIAGALADSLLGASFQALRWCANCTCECETRYHLCGTATTLQRGLEWMGNDAVNLAATLVGAVVALLLNLGTP
jgi:uncharacterized protein (TIGR00297 family)